jgi:hypothetical protein
MNSGPGSPCQAYCSQGQQKSLSQAGQTVQHTPIVTGIDGAEESSLGLSLGPLESQEPKAQ